jgi:hypothetical protein
MLTVGWKTLQAVGLMAPLLQTRPPSGLEEEPPGPEQPPLLHEMQEEPFHACPAGH